MHVFNPIPKYLHVRIGVFLLLKLLKFREQWNYWHASPPIFIGREIFRMNPFRVIVYFPALSSGGQSESLRLGARCRRQLSTTTGTIGSLWRNLLLFHLLGCKSAIEVFWSYGTIILTTNDNNFTYLYKKKKKKMKHR